jgi:uncharacterized membrane protein
MVTETKTRTVIKSIFWRIVATLNSYLILMSMISDVHIKNAIMMNITGFVVYYLYERIWNKIPYGKRKTE